MLRWEERRREKHDNNNAPSHIPYNAYLYAEWVTAVRQTQNEMIICDMCDRVVPLPLRMPLQNGHEQSYARLQVEKRALLVSARLFHLCFMHSLSLERSIRYTLSIHKLQLYTFEYTSVHIYGHIMWYYWNFNLWS